MSPLPSDDEIREIAWEIGDGVCVIVEGETKLDDPWFYQQWFGSEARRFTFIHQDGWEQVEAIVARLRFVLSPKKVYGIVDRDFFEPTRPDNFPSNGILRPKKYTLENYLLDPAAWKSFISQFNRTQANIGWETVEQCSANIRGLYRKCYPVSAFNQTLSQARQDHLERFQQLPQSVRQFREHPKSLENMDPQSLLRLLTDQMETGTDYGNYFNLQLQQLNLLESESFETIESRVSGKYVLSLLKEAFPMPKLPKAVWDGFVGRVASLIPPPEDLRQLLEQIWADHTSAAA